MYSFSFLLNLCVHGNFHSILSWRILEDLETQTAGSISTSFHLWVPLPRGAMDIFFQLLLLVVNARFLDHLCILWFLNHSIFGIFWGCHPERWGLKFISRRKLHIPTGSHFFPIFSKYLYHSLNFKFSFIATIKVLFTAEKLLYISLYSLIFQSLECFFPGMLIVGLFNYSPLNILQLHRGFFKIFSRAVFFQFGKFIICHSTYSFSFSFEASFLDPSPSSYTNWTSSLSLLNDCLLEAPFSSPLFWESLLNASQIHAFPLGTEVLRFVGFNFFSCRSSSSKLLRKRHKK